MSRKYMLALSAILLTGDVVVAGQESCIEGCPTFRSSGFRVSLQGESLPKIRYRAGEGDLTLKGPGLPWAGRKVRESPGSWHEISTESSSSSGFCVSAPTLGVDSKCGPDEYLEVASEYPTLWSLDCSASDCGCGTQSLISLSLPVDTETTLYWLPGSAGGARIIGPGLWSSAQVDEASRNTWHDLKVIPTKGGTSCRLTSQSLGRNWACGENVDPKSFIYIPSTQASGWASSLFRIGCDGSGSPVPIARPVTQAPTPRPLSNIISTPDTPPSRPVTEATSPPTERPAPRPSPTPDPIPTLNIAPGHTDCSTRGTPKGKCLPYSDCPILAPAENALSVTEFVTAFGCGNRDGRFYVCCPPTV